MQTLEAIISLMFFVSFLPVIASEQHAETDDTLYKYQLANDVWRTLYLRNGNNMDAYEEDVEKIGELTDLCIFVAGERITNCRGEKVEQIISTERLVFSDGELKTITVTIAQK